MKVIKANKTQLYGLVKKHSEYVLPAVKYTEYVKAKGAYAYWLKFSDQTGRQVATYLEFSLGRARLRIRCTEDKYDKVFHPHPDELNGMLKESASWVIRYTKTETEEIRMESKVGIREDVERYAAAKARSRGCDYIVA